MKTNTFLCKVKRFFIPFILFFSVNSLIVGQTSLPTISTTITENFNTLASSGSPAWTDATTLPVWYTYLKGVTPTSPTIYYANDGSITNTGRLCSFGTNADADRSLGVVPGGNTGDNSFIGWRLKNNTGYTIVQINVTWTCEQWRVTTAGQQFMRFYYKTNSYDLSTAGTQVGSPVGSPKYNLSASALDGNLAANRVAGISSVISLGTGLPAGDEITLIWGVPKQASAGQFLSIDDISVKAKAEQKINVIQSFPALTYGHAPIDLNNYFSSNSGLTLTYSSSDNNVARIDADGHTLNIVGPGSITIYANQSGNDDFTSAPQNSQNLNINPQTPEMDAASNITIHSFKSTWATDNGLNEANTTYIFQYSTNPDIQAAIDADDGSATSVSDLTNKYYDVTGLLHNNLYYYRVYATNTGTYSGFTQAQTITTGDDFVSDQNGDWDTDLNWDVDYSPNPYGNNVTINTVITANDTPRDSIVVNKLVITQNGKLENNEIINVTGQLIIMSDETGKTGQILNMNNIHLGPSAKIIFRKKFSAAYGWYFTGFPYDVPSTKIYFGSTATNATWGDPTSYAADSPKKDFYVYQYDGNKRDQTGLMNSSSGLNWIDVNPHTFVGGKGYNIATLNDTTIDFVIPASQRGGIFSNSGTESLGQYDTNSCECHRSWNLITSPFASSYDLANTTAEAPYYIYNSVTKGYDVYMSGENFKVYPYQAFFLQARDASMNFVNAGRALKAPFVNNEAKSLNELKIKISNSSFDDVTRIRFENGASEDYIIGSDAAKFVGSNANVPQIYTSINGFSAAVNTLPTTVKSVDLYTKIGKVDSYTIKLANIGELGNFTSVNLIDNKTNITTNLLSDSYSYTETSTGTSNRFKIVATINETNEINSMNENEISLSVNDNKATIHGLKSTARINLFDITGKLVSTYQNISNGQSVDIANKGIYLMEINSTERKVILKLINK